MRAIKQLSILALCAISMFVHGGTGEINPGEVVIIHAADAPTTQKFAAQELQKHIELISGKKVPIQAGGKTPEGVYPFYVGIVPEGGNAKLLPEEAVWKTDASGTWLYGDDAENRGGAYNLALLWRAKTGTLSAVYDFLEKQFGIRWVEPGDKGIVFTPMTTLQLKEGEGGWSPGRLVKRHMRPSLSWDLYEKYVLPKNRDSLAPAKEEYEARHNDLQIWLKRQRQGGSLAIQYGHAFTNWWKMYNESHPEYFAMHEDGTRSLLGGKESGIKLCVSNPGVAEQVVANWVKNQTPTINTCENDGGFFCCCENCKKLDVRYQGENLESHLTDRYVNFTNRIVELASKYNPDVLATMYAYSYYSAPPRREKLNSRVIVGFVPGMLNINSLEKKYADWRAAGAERMFLRPNDQCFNIGLPMGFEKQMFDCFKIGVRNGVIGTDYDGIHGFWPATGIGDYILARGHIYPSESFEHWEDEYCSAFGEAKEDIKEYYRYWRKHIWEERLVPNAKEICELGKYGNFQRGLMWYVGRYYKPSDFDNTDDILKTAASRRLNPQARKRVEMLMLANQHARLTFKAMSAQEKFEAGKELLKFRQDHKNDLNFDWTRLASLEKSFGDVTGVNAAASFAKYSACQQLPVRWLFQIDPQDVGMKGKWDQTEPERMLSLWEPVMVNQPWEKNEADMHPALKKQLENYDGIGWYGQIFKIPSEWNGSKVFLYFGAVDESAWIWINGKKAGERISSKPDDWKTPFMIRIDPFIDWKANRQAVVVRVEDKAGQGGIWSNVTLLKE